MRSNTKTLLSLYDFARILEINPLHFGGVDLPGLTMMHPHCNAQAYQQYAWQFADRTSRESVAQMIEVAESRIREYLGFDVMPNWNVKEEQQTSQPYNPDLINAFGLGGRTFPANVKTRRGYVISGGCRNPVALPIVQQTVEEDGSPVLVNVFWEADSYWMKGEVWATVPAGAAACDVHIYYPGKGPAPEWEIRPATVEIVGSTAVITIRRECAVQPALWDSLSPRAAAGDDDADFLDNFDVFLETIDPSCMLTMLWRPGPRIGLGIGGFPFGAFNCSCGGTGCPQCEVAEQQGCFVATDKKLGYVAFQAADWNPTTGVFDARSFSKFRQPDSLEVSYLAGYQDENADCPRRQMWEPFAQAVTFFAASMLQRPLCACNTDTWRYWRESESQGIRGDYWTLNTTPFGRSRGAVFAWEKVREMSLGRSPQGIR